MSESATAAQRRHLIPFAALSASYFAHIGFFNPYLPLWLKDLGLGIFAISLLTSIQAAMAHLVSSSGAFDARRYGRVRLWGSLGFLVPVLLAGLWFVGCRT